MENPSIFRCCIQNNVEGLRRLIEEGVDINIQNNYGGYAHMSTPLHYSVLHNSKECLCILIEMGANVNAQNGYGNTPLHWAAWCHSKEYLYLLIDAGADINIQDNEGETFLEYIRSANLKKEIEEYLNEISTSHIKEPSF